MPLSTNLSRCVTSSSRLASIFDWKCASSSILSMTIARHRISLSLARHPSIEGRHVIETLEPIPYMPIDRSVMSKAIFQTRKEKIRSQIGKISKDYKVSGYIVGWPLEPSGRPGAACGRVLHILDFLADKREGRVISPGRPLTLWDQRVFTHNRFDEIKKPQDKWGRSAAFCSYPNNHNYNEKENENGDRFYISNHSKDHAWEHDINYDCSGRILKQFLNSHYKRNDDEMFTRHSIEVPYDHFIEQCDDHDPCIESHML